MAGRKPENVNMKTNSDKSKTVSKTKSEATLAAPSGSAKPAYEELIGLLRAVEMALGDVVAGKKCGWMQETTLEEVREKLARFDKRDDLPHHVSG